MHAKEPQRFSEPTTLKFSLWVFGLLSVFEAVWLVISIADSNTAGAIVRALLLVLFIALYVLALRRLRAHKG
jgi:hypothetical protein